VIDFNSIFFACSANGANLRIGDEGMNLPFWEIVGIQTKIKNSERIYSEFYFLLFIDEDS
jgi:hypothetical protein